MHKGYQGGEAETIAHESSQAKEQDNVHTNVRAPSSIPHRHPLPKARRRFGLCLDSNGAFFEERTNQWTTENGEGGDDDRQKYQNDAKRTHRFDSVNRPKLVCSNVESLQINFQAVVWSLKSRLLADYDAFGCEDVHMRMFINDAAQSDVIKFWARTGQRLCLDPIEPLQLLFVVSFAKF